MTATNPLSRALATSIRMNVGAKLGGSEKTPPKSDIPRARETAVTARMAMIMAPGTRARRAPP